MKGQFLLEPQLRDKNYNILSTMLALQYIQGQICNEVALTALIRYDRNRNKPMLNCSTPCTSDNIPEHKTF